MNIHERIKDQTDLAVIYAIDGAFHSSARVLRNLADEIERHANACDIALEREIHARSKKGKSND